jgi:hypothetical protein
MVRTGQAAKRIKKESDAKPKVGFKKIAKDAALNAAMIVGPGKFVKGGRVIKESVDVARKALEPVRGTQKARGVTNAVRPKIQKPEVREVITEPRTAKPTLKRKSKTPPLSEKNKKGGLQTTTGKRKVKVSDAEAKAIAEETGRRPIAPRPRNVPKPGSNSLTAAEKRMQTQVGTVTRLKPKPKMSTQEIAQKKAAERKAKFTKLLTPVKKIGTTKTKPSQRPQLPKHKTNVKIYRKKKSEFDTSNAGAEPEALARGAGKGESGARVTTFYKSRAEIAEEGRNAAQNRANTSATRPKTDISKGRGNVPQPESVTKTGDPAIVRGERVERIQQIKANRGGPKFVKKTKSGQTVSTPKIDSPRNAASNRVIMEKRLQEGEEEAAKVSKRLNAGKDKKVKKNAKKVDATLARRRRARAGNSLQNTFNKPIFKRNPSSGKLTATRPIKPTKE